MTRRLASAVSSSIPAADARMSDDETSIQVLRAGATIAIVFLVIYLAYDLWSGQRRRSYGGIFHWVTVIGALAFLAATFTRGFRAHWKLWNLLFSILLLSDLHHVQRADAGRRFPVHRDPVVSGRDRRFHQLGMAVAGADGTRVHRAVRNRPISSPDSRAIRSIDGSGCSPRSRSPSAFRFSSACIGNASMRRSTTQAGGGVSRIANRDHGA